MKPVYQTIFAPPHGNCLQAGIASLLDLELDDVPNFMIGLPSEWFDRLQAFLRVRGLYAVEVNAGQSEDDWRPTGYHLLTGKSPRGDWLHTVVAKDGEPIHDPRPEGGCKLESRASYMILAATLEAGL